MPRPFGSPRHKCPFPCLARGNLYPSTAGKPHGISILAVTSLLTSSYHREKPQSKPCLMPRGCLGTWTGVPSQQVLASCRWQRALGSLPLKGRAWMAPIPEAVEAEDRLELPLHPPCPRPPKVRVLLDRPTQPEYHEVGQGHTDSCPRTQAPRAWLPV